LYTARNLSAEENLSNSETQLSVRSDSSDTEFDLNLDQACGISTVPDTIQEFFKKTASNLTD
jgi:hypothetical protein